MLEVPSFLVWWFIRVWFFLVLGCRFKVLGFFKVLWFRLLWFRVLGFRVSGLGFEV